MKGHLKIGGTDILVVRGIMVWLLVAVLVVVAGTRYQ